MSMEVAADAMGGDGSPKEATQNEKYTEWEEEQSTLKTHRWRILVFNKQRKKLNKHNKKNQTGREKGVLTETKARESFKEEMGNRVKCCRMMRIQDLIMKNYIFLWIITL